MASALGVMVTLTSPAYAQTLGAAASPVAAFYDTWPSKQIWFRNGPDRAAIAELTFILQRAPFDGFAQGPQLASAVQAAAAQAATGRPEDVAAAEQMLSSAWVQYVRAIKRPTTGMIYAYRVLRPQDRRPDEILLTAAAAPSLAAHLAEISDVNPIYKQLRDAGWADAKATGNFTPDPRLLANLDRVRSLPATGRFVLVDAGSSMLTMFQNGQAVDSMRVITGTSTLPTPLIASYLYYVTYNPYWHAPDHLVKKTIAPNMLHLGMRYFKSHGYHVISDWSDHPSEIDPASIDWKAAAAGTLHLKIQQDPGPLNSMGNLKFPFANPQDIYLHDTPDHGKFELSERNLSNGCVRLEDAHRLGSWLIGHEPVAPGPDPELDVKLPRATPIFLTYITAQVKDGKLTYLPDLYGWDSKPPQFASNYPGD